MAEKIIDFDSFFSKNFIVIKLFFYNNEVDVKIYFGTKILVHLS